MIRTITELYQLETFEERFRYLRLSGSVGEPTFGSDRWINQAFYRSTEWKQIRNHVIARDQGCDLGVPELPIHDRVLIHHMNPMTVDDIMLGDSSIVDPEFLITTMHSTHNAIHYGDERQLRRPFVPRSGGDTRLW